MLWQEEKEDDELRDATREFLPETVVWATDWTTGALLEQISREVFDVDPPFQRRSAWNDVRSSLYIESLLLGCPVPPITLAELPRGSASAHQYVVIDGKQRLGAIKRFALDKTLKLRGLETLKELNGLRFHEVENIPEFSRFSNLPIRTMVMRNWQRDEVLQFVFHRLNSQVTPLSTHELRRSLLAGPFTKYLDEASARATQVQRILNIREPDFRLRDAEILLRAIAFTCFLSKYRGNLKKFLDTTTRNLNSRWDSKVERQVSEVVRDILAAIDFTYEIFGDAAFQRYDSGRPTGRFNRAIFDSMVLIFRYQEVRQSASGRTEDLREAFIGIMGDPEISGWFEATTKTPEAVLGRVAAWAEAVGVVIERDDLKDLARTSALRS
ncbi:hypothetical protein M2160_004501 [Streptomyces sp. SAI-117]|uniref:DUF262 domain-containing protein n=1 Tax=Streptomyces sp. SAI-117 TaxID=2940546 RepID=UPI002475307D|nr:DUF262 domain-containing protein [Streptomyces sp. SAI-117]MDH6569480.1 hypothetical protein [Streptomyces sp. SAI-117]